jgi:hypothetical protein
MNWQTMDLSEPVIDAAVGQRYILCYRPGSGWSNIRMLVIVNSYDTDKYIVDIVSGVEKYRFKNICFRKKDILLYDIFPHKINKPDKLMRLSTIAFFNLPTLDILYTNLNLVLH